MKICHNIHHKIMHISLLTVLYTSVRIYFHVRENNTTFNLPYGLLYTYLLFFLPIFATLISMKQMSTVKLTFCGFKIIIVFTLQFYSHFSYQICNISDLCEATAILVHLCCEPFSVCQVLKLQSLNISGCLEFIVEQK